MTSSIVQAYHRRGESSQCDAKTRRFGAQDQNDDDTAVSHKTAEVLEIEMMRRDAQAALSLPARTWVNYPVAHLTQAARQWLLTR